jgi:hypothetical protein
MGEKQNHPDFVILTPDKGLLFIEVKDWYITKINLPTKRIFITKPGTALSR